MKKLMFILLICLSQITFVNGQGNDPEKLLNAAIYEEEVNGELDKAIKTYQLIVQQYPDNRKVSAEALLHLGICYEKLGILEAYGTYLDLINKYPEQKDKVAIAKERVIRIEEYAADIRKKTEMHISQGNELFERWEYEAAIKEYENAIKLNPNSLMAMNAKYYIGQSQFREGKYNEALSTLAMLMEENPESKIAPVAKLMIAQVQYEQGKNKNLRNITSYASNNGVIIDPNTNIKYTKINTFTGKRDVTGFNLSPNGTYLLSGNLVIPLNGDDPFKLLDMPVERSTWSKNGKMVAFYSKDAIWVVPVSPETGRSTDSPTKLLDGKYRFQFNVSWSPDSKEIVFSRRDEKINDDIWTISVNDGSLTKITSTPGCNDDAPTWSPDGKTIAYGRYEKSHSLWLSSVDGNNARKIIDTEHRCIPIWAPDGQWILLKRSRLIRLADKKDFPLTIPDEVGSFFSWSIDTKKMLFYRPSYDYRSVLKVVSSTGGPVLELGKQVTLWPYEHFWSADNNIIITDGMDKTDNTLFWIIPLRQGEPIPLKLDVPIEKPMPLCLSRDSKMLTFSNVINDETEDLWIVPISLEEGRTIGPAVKVFQGHQRYSGSGGGSAQSWSPDGSKIAISQNGDVWIVRTDGSGSDKLTNTPEFEGWPRWSPDGKMIQTVVKSGDEHFLRIISASEGQQIKKLENVYDITWSPDGKELAVAFKNNDLSVISITGEKIRKIADLKDMELTDVYDLKWSPDGKNIACVGFQTEKQKSWPIFIIPAEGGRVTEVAVDDQGWKNYLYWSPDSKWISYHSDGMLKTRPEGTMWEVDFEEVKEKLLQLE